MSQRNPTSSSSSNDGNTSPQPPSSPLATLAFKQTPPISNNKNIRTLKPHHSLNPSEEAEHKEAEALYAAAADAASDAAVIEEGLSLLDRQKVITQNNGNLPTPDDWSVSTPSLHHRYYKPKKPSIALSDIPSLLMNKLSLYLLTSRQNLGTSISTLFIIILLGATIQLQTNDLATSNRLSTSTSSTSTSDPTATGPQISALSLLSSSYQQFGFSNVKLSKSLQYLANVEDPREENEVPFFFHVPRSGGSTLKDIMGSCLGMVMASDVGARHGHKYDKMLQIMTDEKGSKFVNVDTTTAEGIHRAKNLNLVETGLADVIVTQHLHPAATMFNENQKGRMFTLMRHPIERAVSLFHYLSVADWEPTYDPDLAYISIEMYARSKRIEHNWMVRFLSNELERDLTEKHLEVAKEVLRKKCLVGLLSEKSESFMRFGQYFGWTFPDTEAKSCQERFLHWGWSNKHSHPIVDEDSAAWTLLSNKNDLDMKLYEYAKELFREQSKLFVGQTQQQQQQAVAVPVAEGAAPSAEEVVAAAVAPPTGGAVPSAEEVVAAAVAGNDPNAAAAAAAAAENRVPNSVGVMPQPPGDVPQYADVVPSIPGGDTPVVLPPTGVVPAPDAPLVPQPPADAGQAAPVAPQPPADAGQTAPVVPQPPGGDIQATP